MTSPADPSDNMFGLADRDLACMVLNDLDYDSQLRAIHGLLRAHKQRESALDEEIEKAAEDAKRLSGIRNEQAVSDWVEHLHNSAYQDAAHSMSAVGMIAPFVESVFDQGLRSIGTQMAERGLSPQQHERWTPGAGGLWDCHFVWRNGRPSKNVTEGILQLSEAVGLAPLLPQGFEEMLRALFLYRNRMFHHGFEWPRREREKFARHVESWPDDWFRHSSHGDDPWIFYMSESFIEQWVSTADGLIDAFGAFARSIVDETCPADDGAGNGRTTIRQFKDGAASLGNENHWSWWIVHLEKKITADNEHAQALSKAGTYVAWLLLSSEFIFYTLRWHLYAVSGMQDGGVFNDTYSKLLDAVADEMPADVAEDATFAVQVRHIMVHKGFPNPQEAPAKAGGASGKFGEREVWKVRDEIKSPANFSSIKARFDRVQHWISKNTPGVEFGI